MPAEQIEALKAWLPRQRWFGAKASAIARVGEADRLDLDPGGEAAVVLIEVAAARQPPALYLLTPAAGELDGLALAPVRQRWMELLQASARRPGAHGAFEFEWLGPAAANGASRLLGAEQSNTSILFEDAAGAPRWVLKLFRRLMPGENPEFEVPRALAEHTGFRHVPAAAGRVRYRAGDQEYTLAALQAFVPNQGDGWAYTLRRLAEDAAAEALWPEIALLGRRTAELHTALAGIAADPAFAAEPIVAADLEAWRERARAGALAEVLRPHAAAVAPWLDRLDRPPAGFVGALGCAKIRLHGDYHLGQVLRTADDFVLFDFEGEPARPIPERRRKGCVLQDVAGMLRSFSYAAHTAGRPEWEAGARAAFLASYRAALGPHSGLVPADPAGFAAVLSFFECEKALYELAYELNNRPDWVKVPVAGLSRLLAARA